MSPHLVRWDKQWKKAGLTVIDINNGGMDTKKALAAYVKKQGKKYPTLWDANGQICKKYGIRGYPGAFLIGVDGKVLWEGFPVPEVKKIESLIKAELAKIKKAKKKQSPRTSGKGSAKGPAK